MADTQTPRMRALQNLSAQLPVANSRVAQGRQAARDIQLQQAVAKAPVGGNIQKTAQETGAAAAQNAGEQLIQSAGNQVKQSGQVAQLGLQEQQQQAQANTASLSAGAKEASIQNVQRLAAVSEQAKQELYDKQMTFTKDQQGNTLFNERQLADYAKSSAKSDEQYRNYAQSATQVAQRKLEIMEHSYRVMNADLEQRIKLAEQQKDQKVTMELAQMKRAADKEIASQRAKANNTGAIFQTVGTVAGGVVGAIYGGPAGAMVGASAGGAVGGMVGSQVAANDSKAGQ